MAISRPFAGAPGFLVVLVVEVVVLIVEVVVFFRVVGRRVPGGGFLRDIGLGVISRRAAVLCFPVLRRPGVQVLVFVVEVLVVVDDVIVFPIVVVALFLAEAEPEQFHAGT